MVEELQGEKKIELASKIYSEVCNNIKTTDEISFRLLGLVPLLSAAGIFGISLSKEFASSPLAIVISFFAAIVTGALFMWEWRNLKSCRSYLGYAMLLEKYVFYDALGKLAEKVPSVKLTPEEILQMEISGKFTSEQILRMEKEREKTAKKERKTAEGQFRSRPDTTVIRKTISELIIYSVTILAWTTIGVIALVT